MIPSPYILIGGDVVPTKRDETLFRQGDFKQLLGDAQSLFSNAAASIVNWECPLVETPSPAAKAGPVLTAHTDCAAFLRSSGIQIVGLANNHIRDHGEIGIQSTIRALRSQGTKIVGAGMNLDEARQHVEISCAEFKIALAAVAEHECSIAEKTCPGANPLDLIWLVNFLQTQKTRYQKTILLVHGGMELFSYPTPEMQRVSRFLVEQGADAVIWQHSHCIGCIEEHSGGIIVYGQGNMLFNWEGMQPCWYEGMLVKLTPRQTRGFDFELIPYSQSKSGPGLKLLSKVEGARVLGSLSCRSTDCMDEKKLESLWDTECHRRQNDYLSQLLGHNRGLRFLERHIPIMRKLSSKSHFHLVKNLITCETHREAMENILTDLTHE